ncbi:DUF342 domain-containing protein [Lachnospiraceae bacterium]|jgi:uncharacterized protein (DUF342 family)|nr:DUF342 domain-containing protein [Lachnospiraceae bacterium]GFI16536.1 hypothetical protein IMSAGC009_01701 [Lachnospiraceae bacterium]
MRNGYFQIVCGEKETSLKIFLPEEGGKPVRIREVISYLTRNGVDFDTTGLNKGIMDSLGTTTGEYQFVINNKHYNEVRESYQMQVSQDKMLAIARFYPPSLNGERMTADEFFNDLEHKKIKFGILKKGLIKFFENPVYCADMVVVKGKLPRHGKDASIEYFFETNLCVKPTLKEDGSVDFFNLNTINHCKEGELLARLHPADLGDPGRTIYDEKIKPRDVKRLSIKGDRNSVLSDDRLELKAKVDGHVSLVDGMVFVSNVLEVENVDNATGNIDYDGSVKVNGNVCANFSVKARGDIEVRGVVEGAYLESGGNIIIVRGMNGMGKGVLKAEGNVIAKFLENSKVSAGGYVSTESILHSEVMADSEVIVSGRRGFITGGKVSAAHLVQVKTLGSSMGAATVIEVGADPSVKIRLLELQQQIIDKEKELESLKPILENAARKLSSGIQLRPEQMEFARVTLEKEKSLKRERDVCIKKMEDLQTILNASNSAKVEVTGEVYGGTRISIADVSTIIKGNTHYCRFIKEAGDVKMVPL